MSNEVEAEMGTEGRDKLHTVAAEETGCNCYWLIRHKPPYFFKVESYFPSFSLGIA